MRILFVGVRWFLEDIPNQNFSFKRGMDLAGNNTGNLFIGEGMRHHLIRLFPDIEKIRYLTIGQIENDDYVTAEWANQNFDFIVMAAANMINDSVHLDTLANFVETTNLPFFIFGAGAQAADKNANINVSPSVTKLLKIAAERSHSVGVRGDYTAHIVEKTGIKNIEIMGCPSMYLNTGKPHAVETPISKNIQKAAIFTKRDDLKHHSYPTLSAFQAKQYQDAALRNFYYIIQTNYSEAWLAFHQEIDSKKVSDILSSFRYPKDAYGKMTKKLMQQLRIFFRFHEWRDFIKTLDFTYGARFHGNMMSVMHHTPALFICHDSRTIELCEFLDLPHINILDYDIDNYTFEHMVEAADYSDFNKNYKAKCNRFENYLRQQFKNFLPPSAT